MPCRSWKRATRWPLCCSGSWSCSSRGTAHSDTAVNHTSNYDLFSNIVSGFYRTETSWGESSKCTFRFDRGEQRTFNTSIVGYYSWAVNDGDVAVHSSVPVPAEMWLFGTGRITLFGITLFSITRKKTAKHLF